VEVGSASFSYSDFLGSMVISDSRAYVAAGSTGVAMFDLSSPAAPVLIDTIETPGKVLDVGVSGGILSVLAADGRLRLFTILPALASTTLDDHTLLATVPAGLPPGDYDAVVGVSGDPAAVLRNAFHVLSDRDGDTIPEDGDQSSLVGDHPCATGEATACDDNCPDVSNTDQADRDHDGLGDLCDPVTVTSFTAGARTEGVRLTWATSSEMDGVGFRILRARSRGEPLLLTPVVIPGNGGADGGEYQYLDNESQEPGTVVYYLDEVDTSGASRRHGPVEVRIRRPLERDRTETLRGRSR
jgi:hypothetical protein